jgi:signal transduction histidine kinase
MDKEIKELENENLQLKNRNKELTDFIFDMVHDLKNPALVITGYLKHMIANSAKDEKDSSFSMLRKMDKELHLLNDILKRFMDFIKLYNSIEDITIHKVELLELLKYNYEYYQEIALEKNIKIILHAEESIPEVIGNEEKISYIFSALFINLINFLEKDNSITVEIKNDKIFVSIIFSYNKNFIINNSDNTISNYKMITRTIVDIMEKLSGSFGIDNSSEKYSLIILRFKKYD